MPLSSRARSSRPLCTASVGRSTATGTAGAGTVGSGAADRHRLGDRPDRGDDRGRCWVGVGGRDPSGRGGDGRRVRRSAASCWSRRGRWPARRPASAPTSAASPRARRAVRRWAAHRRSVSVHGRRPRPRPATAPTAASGDEHARPAAADDERSDVAVVDVVELVASPPAPVCMPPAGTGGARPWRPAPRRPRARRRWRRRRWSARAGRWHPRWRPPSSRCRRRGRGAGSRPRRCRSRGRSTCRPAPPRSPTSNRRPGRWPASGPSCGRHVERRGLAGGVDDAHLRLPFGRSGQVIADDDGAQLGVAAHRRERVGGAVGELGRRDHLRRRVGCGAGRRAGSTCRGPAAWSRRSTPVRSRARAARGAHCRRSP